MGGDKDVPKLPPEPGKMKSGMLRAGREKIYKPLANMGTLPLMVNS